MRTGCVILGLLFFCLVVESNGLRCYHCGWGQEKKNYQKPKGNEISDLPYPVVERYITEKITEEKGLSHPPTKQQVEKYCKKTNCNQKNSACLKWSFISNHPINITYMCVGDPGNNYGCYRQVVPNKDMKDFLQVEACLCKDDFCNSATQIPMNSGMFVFIFAFLFIRAL